jgi:RHS repeat-associated protein
MGITAGSAAAEPLCTDTWTGGSEGMWETAENWSAAHVPSSSDVACIGSGTTVRVRFGSYTAGVLSDAGTLVIKEATLEVSNTLEASSIHALVMEYGATLSGAATVDISSSLRFTGGSSMSGSGSTVLQSGASETSEHTNATISLHARKFVNEGTCTLESGRIGLFEGATFENLGTFDANDEELFGIIDEEVGADPHFINVGTFQKTEGTGETRVEVDFENRGTVNGKTGKIVFRHAERVETLTTGSVLEGTVLFKGVSVSAGSFSAPSGSVTLEEGTMTIPTATTVSIAHFVMKSLAVVTGAGTLSVSSTFSWAIESTMSGTGKTILLPGSVSTIAMGAGIAHLKQRTFINEGTISLEELSILGQSESSRFENLGTFVANSETEFYTPSLRTEGTPELAGTFVNVGSFEKNSGLERPLRETVVETPFVNEGRVLENVGALKFLHKFSIEASSQYGNGSEGPGHICAVCGDPVDAATGNLVESQTDFNIGGRGVGLNITRTYNSQAAAEGTLGPFGYGWSGSFTDHLSVESGHITLHAANGSTVVFTEVSGSYVAPPWSQDKLSGTAEAGYTLTLPNQTQYKFQGSSGHLESVTDRNGNIDPVIYVGSGPNIEFVRDPTPRGFTFHYNAEGLIETIEDPMGHVVKYAYEGKNLVTVTYPGEVSARWHFKYDGSHQLTEMTDGRGGVTVNVYNAAHQVTEQTDPMKRLLTFQYTQFRTKITNHATGAVTDEYFTGSFEPSAITHGYGTAQATTEYFAYNAAGYPIRHTDGNGHVTKYGYDSENNRTSLLDPEKHESTWTYNSTHDVTSETTPRGETTTIKRDTHGDPEVIERPAPAGKTQRTKYKYNANGQLESVTDPLERTTTYTYNTQGDLASETDPAGDKRTWEYDKASRAIASVSPRGNVTGGKPEEFKTKITRDAQERPTLVTDPLTHTTKYAYDANGNLETTTDGNSHTTTYTYNADNAPTKVKEPNGTVTETEYDGAGHVVSQTDGNKHTTKYIRNILGEVTEVTDPLGHKTLKEYDAAGNLIALTDPAKRVTKYAYDTANRLSEVSYSDGKTPAVKYEYDADNDRTKMIDGTGTSTYGYDVLDRLTETKDGHGDTAGYEYDLANEQTKITYPSGKAVTQAFDKASRLERATDWLEHATTFKYDADSDLTKTTFPTGTSNEDIYSYNNADQLTKSEMKKAAEVLASITYTRDSDGQLKTATQKSLPGEEKPSYIYDENNRLTKGGTTEYKYDAASNPTKVGTSTNTFNAGDELEKGTGVTYGYDESGERTKRSPTAGPATTYGYDQAGRMTSVERPKEGETAAITDSYGYDGEMLRRSETISGTTTYLTWDTSDPLPLVLNDGTNSYVYGPGGLPIEQVSSGGTVLYVHHDQQGSTRLLTSSTGAKEASFTYDSYGNTTGTTGTAKTPLGYDAQYTTNDTGLIYLRQRVYDPATAQFLSGDPLGAVTWEPYSYSYGNPVNKIDPSGLYAIAVPVEGPAAPACLTPETIGPCIVVGGAGYVITEGVKSVVNAWAGGDTGNDEGEAFLKQRQAEDAEEGECRQLPPRSLPYRGEPNSTGALDRGNGAGQIRDYGPDGLPHRDFDFGHDHGFGDPHAHDWLGGVRGPGRPIGPNE